MELFKSRTRVAYTNAVGDKVYPVVVDIKRGIKSTEEIQFMSSDVNTGILSVAFIQGNETYNVSGAEVVCSVMRPDASTLDIPCTIVENNIVEVPLGINGTSQDGIYSFDFKVFKGGNKVVGTPIMNYSVSLSISNDNAVLEDDRLPVLTMLMTQLSEIKDEARETINQANTATEATREATAKAIEATNKASETVNKVTQDTANAIAEVNATSDTMVENVNNAISSMDTTVNNKISEMTDTVNDKISEVNIAKNDMINDVSSTKANMVTEVTNAKDEMATTVTNKVNEVENRFNALTASQQQSSEVIDARDGETSLKARLDRDIEKAKQVYASVEGSYISTDSSSGYAKDVEILGNTIQSASNLADIKSVGDKVEGQELYEIPVLSYGKNLFDGKLEVGYLSDADGTPLNTISTCVRSANFTKLDINKTYTISNDKGYSIVWYFYDVNYNFVGQGDITKRPSNCVYIKFRTSIGKNENDVSAKFQIEEGTVATPYEPYIEDKLTILSPVQLEKVGDVVDRIIEKDGVLGVEKNVETIVLNGTEAGWYSNDIQKFYEVPVADIVTPNTTVICDKYMHTISGTGNEAGKLVTVQHSAVRIYPTNYDNTTLSEFKKELNVNNVTIKYPTTQPTFTPLPHDQQIKLRTFANKTNISFLTEIEGTIKAQVPKSIGATINTHNEQIRSLNNELNRVKKLEESTVSTVTTESDFTTVEATTRGYFDDVKLEGKTLVNLFRFTTLNNHSNTEFRANFEPIIGNKTYTVINNCNKKYMLDIRSLDGLWLRNLNVDSNLCVFTLGDNEKCSFVKGVSTDGWDLDNSNLLTKTIILEGDHTQNPPNGYIEGLKSVGQSTSDDGVDEIVVSSVNENLLDGDLLVYGMFNYSNGDVEVSTTTKHIAYPKLIKIEPNTTYYSYGNLKVVTFLDANKKYINWTNVSNKITTPSNCCYVKIRTLNELGGQLEEYKNNSYFSKQDKYIPHKSDKKRLLYYNEETQAWEKPILREWDSIEKHADGKYYYHQRSGEVVLNGSEDWLISGHVVFDDSLGFETYCINSNLLPVSSSVSNFIVDKFSRKVVYDINEEGMWSNNVGGYLRVRVMKSKLPTQDVQGFKQWLQANNVTVVYQLAQEKVYECTNIDLITYANETNYIVESGAIAPKSILKVHNNISNVVKILQEKVSLLENKFIEGLKKVLAGDMYSLAELLYPEDFVEEDSENKIMLLPFE